MKFGLASILFVQSACLVHAEFIQVRKGQQSNLPQRRVHYASAVKPVTLTVTKTVHHTSTVTAACGTASAPTSTTSAHTSASATSSAVLSSAVSSSTPTSDVPVSGAGVVLNPSAVAEAHPVDRTEVKAFSAATIKTSSGQCLFVDPTAGDFRENLIPIQVTGCDGSPNEQFDIVTSGVHNDQDGQALVISTLTNACLNFDPRRAAGNQVLLFSCGGRADGSGTVTDSQLFAFSGGDGSSVSLALVPENGNGASCLVPNGSLLDIAPCTGGADQLFTISI